MNKLKPLDQTRSTAANAVNHATKVNKNFESANSIMSRLLDFASSVPDFRRRSKGNIRHKLSDVIVLMIFARMSKCVARAEIREYGLRHLDPRKMGLLRNGVPSEPTLRRIECGVDDLAFADKMRLFAESFQKELAMVTMYKQKNTKLTDDNLQEPVSHTPGATSDLDGVSDGKDSDKKTDGKGEAEKKATKGYDLAKMPTSRPTM